MRKISITFLVAVCALISISSPVAAGQKRCAYPAKRKATGFYRVEQVNGIWWFVTPKGDLMYSIGLTDCPGYHLIFNAKGGAKHKKAFDTYEKGKPSAAEWAKLIKSWGFTNAAAWKGNCNDRLPSTPCLLWWRMARQNWCGPKIPKSKKYPNLPDVFSKEFAEWSDLWAKRIVAPMADDPKIIGWYIDNEEHLPLDAGFQHKYYQVVTSAIRKYDKNHLLLGSRYVSPNPPALSLMVESKYVDVVSVNEYRLVPSLRSYERMHRLTGKPVLVGEYAFGSKEKSPNPTFIADGIFLEKSADRWRGYQIFNEVTASEPFMIGTSYYRFTPWGPNDWGVTDYDGKVIEEFVSKLAAINKKLPYIHAGQIKAKKYPRDYPEYKSKLGHNDRPHTVEKGVILAKDGSWAWQYGNWYWECTPGTDMLTYHRQRDGLWGQKKGGFLEYKIDLKKPMADAHLYLRYAMLSDSDAAKLKIIVNGKEAGTIDLVSGGVGETGPKGWDYGYCQFKYYMTSLDLKAGLKKGVNTIRLEVAKPWQKGKHPVIHGFFVTVGKQKITAQNYKTLDKTK